LRGFPATPEFVLRVAPTFRGQVRRATPDWPELIQAAFEVRAALGVSRHAWGQACLVLGRKEATVALAAIAAKHTRGQVASPGGYLREFVAAHQEGRLRLDRTLFGLADGLPCPPRRRDSVARAGAVRDAWP
jgi:replication initiation protein RepC